MASRGAKARTYWSAQESSDITRLVAISAVAVPPTAAKPTIRPASKAGRMDVSP
jgi:hypothetical protein